MNHIDLMLDLETLSLDSYATVFQISAVPFDLKTGAIEGCEPFNSLINPITSTRAGSRIEGSTVEWWFKQDREVVDQVLIRALTNGHDIKEVLETFSKYIQFLKDTYKVKKVYLWGNGVKADNVWLENQYKLLGQKYPVSFREDMDLRTLVRLGLEFGIDLKDKIEFVGNKHNAIDDCKHQIKYASEIMKQLNLLLPTVGDVQKD